MRYLGVLIIFFLFGLVFPISAHAATYYVSNSGSDTSSGSQSTPWKTIQKAANTLTAGDTVYIRAGVYNEQVIAQNSGNISDGYIIYRNYGSEVVTIDGNNLELGIWDGLFWIDNKSHIKVIGLRVINAAGGYDTHGIRVDDSSYITVQDNYTYNSFSSGIGVWTSNNIVVDGNEIELANNGGYEENLSINGSNIVEVKNNFVHDGFDSPYGGEGINIKDGSSNVSVHDNIVSDNPKYAFGVDGWDTYTHDIDFYNNIATNSYHGFIVESEQGGLVENVNVYNNIAYNNRNGMGFYIPIWANNEISTKRNINFINNTSVDNGAGISIISVAVENIVVRNNLIVGNWNDPQISISEGALANTTADHNLFFNPNTTVGTSAIAGDPLFTSDFHLQTNSPACTGGEGGTYIGAYPCGSPPPPTPTPTPVSTPKQGDLNSDGSVNSSDYAIFVSNFGKTGSGGFIPSDIDNNGEVDIFDYNILVANFGK